MFTFSSFSKIIPRIYSQTCRSVVMCSQHRGPKSLLKANIPEQSSLATSVKPDSVWSFDFVRTVMRNHFPYPKETKRVKVHGYKKRMSTRGGRAVIMRRILKGRHVLAH